MLVTEGSLLNTGLIVGSERAMVIDTGCGPRQAREILDAVREKTHLPLVVVNTHAHYDHFFGNAVFAEAGVDIDKPVVATCGSGMTASIIALALARLGRPRTAVYDGAWTEWGGREDTPIVTGA